jgi:hypothetical protein
MEQFLRTRGALTPSRLLALNQARFEIARMLWLENPALARRVIDTIKECQPKFVPGPPAARRSYRWIYQALGFDVAERIAAYKRGLRSGTTTSQQ